MYFGLEFAIYLIFKAWVACGCRGSPAPGACGGAGGGRRRVRHSLVGLRREKPAKAQCGPWICEVRECVSPPAAAVFSYTGRAGRAAGRTRPAPGEASPLPSRLAGSAEPWKINTWEPGGKYFQALTRECILTRPR